MAQIRWFAAVAAGIHIACAPSDKASSGGGGTLVVSTAGDPNSLFPPLVGTTQGRQVTDLVYDRLASLGDSLNTIGDHGFIPQLAKSWTWAHDSMSVAFHLDPNAKWHDGVPVTASDVRFTLAAYRDTTVQSSASSLVAAIDSISAPDSLTAVLWFHSRSPEQFYDATDQMSIIPEHIWKHIPVSSWRTSKQASRPIGSGQFRFSSWKQGESVTLVADPANYRGRPKLDRIIWSIAPDFNTAMTRFLGGETDLFEAVRAENLSEIAKHPELKVVTFQGIDYSFLRFNLADPSIGSRPNSLFGDRALRRALTMAVDRKSIVSSVYDTLGVPALAASIRAYPTTDPTIAQIPFDTVSAKQQLDSLGWHDVNGDGIRERDGRELAFSVLVPSSSKARARMAVLLQEQLRAVGARVAVEQVEFPTFIERTDTHKFDAAIDAIHADPSPGGVRTDWESRGVVGGNNSGSYRSAAFDAVADSAVASYDPATRRALFSRAYRIIIDDAPAIWLAEPKSMIGHHRRIRVSGLRADVWWQHVADWWIPAEERIARDLGALPGSPSGDSQRKAR